MSLAFYNSTQLECRSFGDTFLIPQLSQVLRLKGHQVPVPPGTVVTLQMSFCDHFVHVGLPMWLGSMSQSVALKMRLLILFYRCANWGTERENLCPSSRLERGQIPVRTPTSFNSVTYTLVGKGVQEQCLGTRAQCLAHIHN